MALSPITKLFLCLPLLLTVACRSARYVPVETVTVRTDTVETVRTDTLWREAQAGRRDSLVLRDSILIKEYVRETVDTAGRVVRTDRELEKTVVRQQESYTALLLAYRELEKAAEQLRTAAHWEQQQTTAAPQARSPSMPWKLLAILSALCAALGGYAGWRLRGRGA